MPELDINDPIMVSLVEAEQKIESGWLLQYRGNGWLSSAIRMAGGSPHSHSAMTRKNSDGTVTVLEMVEFLGGRDESLAFHAEESPGLIDVFKSNREGRWDDIWNADGAVRQMELLVEYTDYGYRGVVRAGLRKLPIAWRLYPVDTKDILVPRKGINPFCSHAFSLACDKGGKVDVVLRRPHWLVEPSHLTHSMFFDYQFTVEGLVSVEQPTHLNTAFC